MKPKTYRLPERTIRQLTELAAWAHTGNKTAAIIAAGERYYREMKVEKEKEKEMLKTYIWGDELIALETGEVLVTCKSNGTPTGDASQKSYFVQAARHFGYRIVDPIEAEEVIEERHLK